MNICINGHWTTLLITLKIELTKGKQIDSLRPSIAKSRKKHSKKYNIFQIRVIFHSDQYVPSNDIYKNDAQIQQISNF